MFALRKLTDFFIDDRLISDAGEDTDTNLTFETKEDAATYIEKNFPDYISDGNGAFVKRERDPKDNLKETVSRLYLVDLSQLDLGGEDL